MKCPLIYRLTYYPDGSINDVESDCIKEECAWWLPQGSVCAIASLAIDLEIISTTADEFQRKMLREV